MPNRKDNQWSSYSLKKSSCWVTGGVEFPICPGDQLPEAALNLKRWHVSSWVPDRSSCNATPISVLGASILPFPQASAPWHQPWLSSHIPHLIHKQFQWTPLSGHSPFPSNCFSPPPLLPPGWYQLPSCRLDYCSSFRPAASPCPPLPPTVYFQHSSQGDPLKTWVRSHHSPTQNPPPAPSHLEQKSKSFLCLTSLHCLVPASSPSSTPHRAPCMASYLVIMFLACLEYKPLEDRDFCSICSLLYVQGLAEQILCTCWWNDTNRKIF